MAEAQKNLPKWILIVSGVFALMEILVSISIFVSPESVLDKVDHSAMGVDYLMYMWATRQFALGFILAFATWKRSAPMLTIAYIFFLVMFIGDFIVGITQKDTGLAISAAAMCVIASAILFFLGKRK